MCGGGGVWGWGVCVYGHVGFGGGGGVCAHTDVNYCRAYTCTCIYNYYIHNVLVLVQEYLYAICSVINRLLSCSMHTVERSFCIAQWMGGSAK